MDRETDEYPFNGEILPPDFVKGMTLFHTHEAFDDLCRRYGREQATKLWHEIPQEHEDEQS
jgi:hypothetical protein